MKKASYQSVNDVRLIDAGLRAKRLRAQLAVTYAASTQIIEAMRKLREGIPLPDRHSTAQLTCRDVDD